MIQKLSLNLICLVPSKFSWLNTKPWELFHFINLLPDLRQFRPDSFQILQLLVADIHFVISDSGRGFLKLKSFLGLSNIVTFILKTNIFALENGQLLERVMGAQITINRFSLEFRINIINPNIGKSFSSLIKEYGFKTSSTAKRKLERLQFSTLSSFVKISSACSCEFKAHC